MHTFPNVSNVQCIMLNPLKIPVVESEQWLEWDIYASVMMDIQASLSCKTYHQSMRLDQLYVKESDK